MKSTPWLAVAAVSATLVVAAIVLGQVSKANADEEAAVRDTLMKSALSFEKNDLAMATQVWANDESLTVFESGHANYGWTDYRDHHLVPEMGEMKNTAYVFSDVKIHLAGTTAWATLKYNVAADIVSDGQPRRVDSSGLATAVLEQRGGQWRIVHWHSSAPRHTPQATPTASPSGTPVQEVTKPPEVIVLGEKATLGKVTFSHLNHTTKNYNIEGIRPVQCTECHHVEQPEAEARRFPPHQTAYPANRTTTLTAELLAKEPGTKVTPCRSCHARKDEKPALWPAIPEIKSENSTAIITMTNQQAFHRACAGCHDQVLKARPEAKAPTTTKCTMCHKKV